MLNGREKAEIIWQMLFLGSPGVFIPNRMSIRSAIFAQPTRGGLLVAVVHISCILVQSEAVTFA